MINLPTERRADPADKIEKPRERSERRDEPKPAPSPARVDEKEPVESTAADRKRSRSVRSAEMVRTESEVIKQQPVEVREPPKPAAREPPRERTTEQRPRDVINDGGTRRTALYAGLAAVAGAAVVGVVAVGWLSSSSSGPATLVVRSEPRGARVLLDGADTGQTTPALLKGVTSGEPHKVRLELEGHSPLDEVVTVPKKGTTQDINFTLAPQR